MTQAMTQQQFDAYLESTGNGVSSENDNVSSVSNAKGTLDEPIKEGNDEHLTFFQIMKEAVITAIIATVVSFVCALAVIGLYNL